jgi:hypothetical protein
MLIPLWGVLAGGEIFGLLLGLVVFIVVLAWLTNWRPPWSSSVAGTPPAPYGNWVGGLIGLAIFLVFFYIVLRLADVIVF